MNSSEKKLPVYAKLSLIILGTLAFFYIMYIGQEIIVPLILSTIIAILLNPLVKFLTKRKVNHVLAILLVLATTIILIFVLIYFLSAQVARFSDSFPQFQEKFSVMLDDVINWVSNTFHIGKSKILAWIEKTKGEGLQNSTTVISQTLGTIGGILILVFLLPVYVFMILFYKPLLLEFIARLFRSDKHGVVAEVLSETKVLVQNYLVGLLLEAALVAILNSVGLMIIGLDYAILLGIIGALLNVIPYIGGIVAISLPMLLAFATKSPIDALWVFIVYMVVQFIDNNFIVPKIVASKVKVNALVSIIVVLIGGALWGVSGMFLSIPLTAIIKVIFDKIEPLTPFGFLIGDNQPQIGESVFKFKKPVKKAK
jgi:predicted PurR-regulated permease PerM